MSKKTANTTDGSTNSVLAEEISVEEILKLGESKRRGEKPAHERPAVAGSDIPAGYDLAEVMRDLARIPEVMEMLVDGLSVPKRVQFNAGDRIRGLLYEGSVGKQSFVNEETGEVKDVDLHSFVVPVPGVTGKLNIIVMGDHTLDKELPRLVGKKPTIIKGNLKAIQGGKKQLRDYIIGVPVA